MRQKLQWSNALDCCWSFPGLLTVFWSRRVMTGTPATDPWLVWMPTGLRSLSWTMLEDECSSKSSCNFISGSLPVHTRRIERMNRERLNDWTIELSNYRTIEWSIDEWIIVSRVIVLFQFSQRRRFSSFHARKLRSSSSVTLRSSAELRQARLPSSTKIQSEHSSIVTSL